MIDIRNEDVVAERRTSDGRWVLFTKTDVDPQWPLPWWGAVCETGGDGFGLLARLHRRAAPGGWTARQILLVARRRLAAEGERLPLPATRDAVAALDEAAVRLGRYLGEAEPTDVAFRSAGASGLYPWTTASQGGFDLALCPDPESRAEGISPEQLLIILDQLLRDAARLTTYAADLWRARGCLSAALTAETKRLAHLRA